MGCVRDGSDALRRPEMEFVGVGGFGCPASQCVFSIKRLTLTSLLLSPGSNRISLFLIAKINTDDDS